MKASVRKLDEAAVRRDYPLADRLPGWYFRLREVSAGVWRAEGTDLWGRQVAASGTDEAQLLEECTKSASAIQSQLGEREQSQVLFHEYGAQLRMEGEELVLNVLCGSVGQFGVEFSLDDTEREQYGRDGDVFIQTLAERVRQDPSAYAGRGRTC